MNDVLKKLEIDLVIYDESQYFREYDDPLFKYPFSPRKTRFNNLRFQIWNTTNYKYYETNLYFRRASACLEGNFMDQFNFFGSLVHEVLEVVDEHIVKVLPEDEPSVNPEKDRCDSLFFEKIKFLKNSEEYHNIEDNYDGTIISELDYFIWLDLKIL